MVASRRNGRLLLGGHCRRMQRRSGGCQKAALASAAAKAANEGSCGDEQADLAMCLGRWQRAVGWRARRQAQRQLARGGSCGGEKL